MNIRKYVNYWFKCTKAFFIVWLLISVKMFFSVKMFSTMTVLYMITAKIFLSGFYSFLIITAWVIIAVKYLGKGK